MAFEYFLYNTNFNNTLIDRSATSFAPLPPNTGEIFLNFSIPLNQPLYLYRESSGNIILNSESTINSYVESINVVNGDSNVTISDLTGYTATTAINFSNKLDTTIFNIYSGTTAPNQFAAKTNFNTFTGTTAPATYLGITPFNSYSGLTLTNINSRLLKTDFNVYTGTTQTNLNNKLNSSIFNGYTGTTAPATYQTKSSINTYTGTTAPNQFAAKSNFNTFTGTTAPNTYLSISNFNSYSASTLSNVNNRLLTSSFNIYSATTQSTLNGKIGSANNGLNKVGTNVRLGGSLTGNTTITTATGSRLNFAGWSLQYNSDLSGTYNPRSLVDQGYVTGLTSILSTTANNGLNKVGNNVRLGGSLTGTTTITSATGSRFNFAGFPVQYSTDLSSSFVTRSIVDKGYVTGITSTLATQAKLNTYTGTTAPATYNGGITWRNTAFPLGGGFPTTKITDIRFYSGITASISSGSLIVINSNVYGTEFQLVESNASSTSNSTTPQTKVTMVTSNLPKGYYKIFCKWRFSHASASNSARFDVTLNGTPVGTQTPISVEPKDTTNITSLTVCVYQLLIGVNTILLRYYNENNTNTTISDASIELIRVE